VSCFGELQCTPAMAEYEALGNFHSLGGSIVLVVSHSPWGGGGFRFSFVPLKCVYRWC
jgi:hypothetical protein